LAIETTAMTENLDGARTFAFEDLDAFYAHAEQHQWTDGLPVVPPTPARVDAMIAGSGRARHESLGVVPPRFGDATIEVVAVNAVMAGCRPEYMPIIVTAFEALLDPAFDLRVVQTTTHPCGIMVLVSGALAPELRINSEGGCFGPGPSFGANMTIGRAIRLVLLNVGGAYPQLADISTQGSPGKLSFCFAENAAATPWEPYHVSLGFPVDATTVTVAAAESPHNLNDHVSGDPDGMLFTFAQTIATMGKNNAYVRNADFFVVLCPEHAALLDRAGWSRADVQGYFFDRARIPFREWRRGGMFGMLPQPRFIDAADDDLGIPMTGSPDNVHVVVAGGGGRHSSWIPTFAANGFSVTRAVGRDSSSASAVGGNRDERLARIRGVLSPMAQTLRADGYDLAVRWGPRSKLELQVTAGPDACEDCLVPSQVFEDIVADLLAKAGEPMSRALIQVRYPQL
jgi:hypothetical protein